MLHFFNLLCINLNIFRMKIKTSLVPSALWMDIIQNSSFNWAFSYYAFVIHFTVSLSDLATNYHISRRFRRLLSNQYANKINQPQFFWIYRFQKTIDENLISLPNRKFYILGIMKFRHLSFLPFGIGIPIHAKVLIKPGGTSLLIS